MQLRLRSDQLTPGMERVCGSGTYPEQVLRQPVSGIEAWIYRIL
jgi:hypothetical protein